MEAYKSEQMVKMSMRLDQKHSILARYRIHKIARRALELFSARLSIGRDMFLPSHQANIRSSHYDHVLDLFCHFDVKRIIGKMRFMPRFITRQFACTMAMGFWVLRCNEYLTHSVPERPTISGSDHAV